MTRPPKAPEPVADPRPVPESDAGLTAWDRATPWEREFARLLFLAIRRDLAAALEEAVRKSRAASLHGL